MKAGEQVYVKVKLLRDIPDKDGDLKVQYLCGDGSDEIWIASHAVTDAKRMALDVAIVEAAEGWRDRIGDVAIVPPTIRLRDAVDAKRKALAPPSMNEENQRSA